MRRSALTFLSLTLLLLSGVAQNPPAAGPAPTPAQTQAAPTPDPAKTPQGERITQSEMAKLANTPTESDMYCSGFISKDAVPNTARIVGGLATPEEANYTDRETVFLSGGSYEPGAKFAVLRRVRDVNKYEPFKEQKKISTAAGFTYQELGRVRVIDVQKNIAVAVVELSCDPFNPGDTVIPWVDRPMPTYRDQPAINAVTRFVPPNGKVTGRIIAADAPQGSMLVTTKSKPYLNVGATQGIKAGDYFRVIRDYNSAAYNIDSLSYKAYVTDITTVDNPPNIKENEKQFPRRVVGELMVLYTTPSTATAAVTRSLETIEVGDTVELMEEPPPPPLVAPPPMNPPTMTCTASPASIHVGETANLRCNATSPDDRPLTYTWTVDNGAMNPRDNTAVLDARNAQAGAAKITTTVTDDRNLTASAVTTVNVEAAPVAEASNLGELGFKANSAYVDNRAKAFLDTVALRLQREANSNALLVGYSAVPESARLGISRASNAKTYLTKEKGIDPGRIQVKDGGRGGAKVDVWFVPEGAAMPNIPEPAPEPAAPAKKPAAKKPATRPAAAAAPKK